MFQLTRRTTRTLPITHIFQFQPISHYIHISLVILPAPQLNHHTYLTILALHPECSAQSPKGWELPVPLTPRKRILLSSHIVPTTKFNLTNVHMHAIAVIRRLGLQTRLGMSRRVSVKATFLQNLITTWQETPLLRSQRSYNNICKPWSGSYYLVLLVCCGTHVDTR